MPVQPVRLSWSTAGPRGDSTAREAALHWNERAWRKPVRSVRVMLASMADSNAAHRKRDPNMKRAWIAGMAFVVALGCIGSAMAQPQGGSGVVSGVVIGPDDKPVPHAIVTYQSGGGTAPHVAHADARGHFTISKLRNDNYALRASGEGVFSAWENVAVHSGRTKTVTLHTIYAKEIPKAYTATRTYEQN